MSAEKQTIAGKPLVRRCWIGLSAIEPLSEGFLLNISATGGKIKWQADKPQLRELDLYLTSDGQVGRKCEVMWQTEYEIGLKFVSNVVPRRSMPACEGHIVVIV